MNQEDSTIEMFSYLLQTHNTKSLMNLFEHNNLWSNLCDHQKI
jgi:hypothetical protein